MAGNRDSSGGDSRAATVTVNPLAPAGPGGDTPDRGTGTDDPGRKRRPRPLTVVAVVAVALFAVWGIGTPLFGITSLTPTDEMVSEGPWVNAGYPDTEDTNTYLDDTYTSQLPATLLFKQQLGHGKVAEWNPYGSGGSPLAAVPDYAFFSPLTIPFYVLPTWLAPAYERLLEIVCAVGGTFLFLRRLSVSRPAALVGGMVFASSGFMVAWLGFPQTRVAAFIPALFWTVERFIQLRRIRDAALVAVPVASLLLGGFPSVAGYALLTGVCYVFVRLISQHHDELLRIVRPILYLTGALAAGIALALFQLIPFLAFFQTWLIEGRQQTASSALPTDSVLTALNPWVFGSVNPAHGTQFVLNPNMVEVVSYVGAAAAVLVLVAVAMPRQGRALLPRGMWVFFMIASAIWVELAWIGGPPLAVVQHLPVLRSLFEQNYIGRARSILGFQLAVPAAIGFELLIRRRTQIQESLRNRRIWAALIGVAGITVLALLIIHGREVMRQGAEDSGQDVGLALTLYRDQIVATVIIITVAMACVVALRLIGTPNARFAGERIRRGIRFGAATALILLIAGQGAQFMAGYYPHSPKNAFYPVTDTQTYLADNLGDQRYASTFNSIVFGTNTAYDLRSVNGHTFMNANFAALINAVPDGPIPYPTYIDFVPGDPAQATSPVLDLLGTKYYVTGPGEPVFGTLHPAPHDNLINLVPGKPVTVPLSTTGALRGIGFTPEGVVADSIAAVDKNTRVDVVITDSNGKQWAKSSRITAGTQVGIPFDIALTAEDIPAGTALNATITLHADTPLTVDATNNTVAVDTITDINDDLRVVYTGSTTIYQRMNALPRIRWASRSSVVRSEDKRVQLLSSGTVAADSVVLSNPGPAASGKPATVNVRDDGTDSITTAVNAQGGGYLVVADADQVGWTASVDGKRADLVPADEGLVAVHVPAGGHDVTLRYGLPHQRAAAWLSSGVAAVLILVTVGDFWWDRRRRRHSASAEAI